MWQKIVECKTEDEALKIIEIVYKHAYESGWDRCDEERGEKKYFDAQMDNSYLDYVRE
jgi:hypothetical protein